MTDRDEFEEWISGPPFERSTNRFPDNPKYAWPGNYRDIDVSLAWHAWQAATKTVAAAYADRMTERAWMDKAIDPPPTDPDARIIVWGIDWPAGAVICLRDGLGWSDVVDHVEVYFRYWTPAPGAPE